MELDGPGVAVSDVVAVARHGSHVHLSADALDRMAAARSIVEALAEGEPAYGISTGFGALANTTIPVDRRVALQQSLIRSHAAGMGPPVEAEVVRAMMFLRARTLAFGASGARPQVAETLVRLINAGVVPVVPEHGSLGASGDLAPLAHAALVLMGEGEALTGDGGTISGAAALAAAGIEPLVLAEKEGLALTNGTDGILGMLCLAVHDLAGLLRVADIVAACSVEALLATDRAFAADLLALRPHPGQQASAANLRTVLAGSPIVASHRHDDRPCAGRLLHPVHPPGARRGSRHLRLRRRGDRSGAGVGDRQSDGDGRWPGRVVRQLSRGAGRAGSRLSRHRRGRGRRHLGAAHRPVARRQAFPRSAAVPG